jgi:hypothetical protein
MPTNNDNKEIAKELVKIGCNTAGNLFAGVVIIVCVMALLSVLVGLIQEWLW